MLDLAAAAVVIICVIVGSRKGAAVMLVSAVGYIAALAAAIFVSEAADEYVYDTFVKPSVDSMLEKKAEELSERYSSEEWLEEFLAENGISFDGEQLSQLFGNDDEDYEVLTKDEIRAKLNNVFIDYCRALTEAFSGILPEEAVREAYRYIEETNMDNQQKLELLASDGKAAVELVEREIIRPILLKTVRTVLFFLTFALVSAAVSLISAAVRAIRGISAVRQTDDFLGGMLGFLHGIIISAAICVLVKIFIQLTSDGNQYINSDIIAETIVFKWIYSGTVFLLSLILK